MIGQDLDAPRLRAALDRCLLSPAEYAAGPVRWRRLSGPFGAREAE